jgi:hypothetical protein
VAIQLIDCSRGLPQSSRKAGLLRNDKQAEFIYRSAATDQSASLIATPSFLGLAMTSRCVTHVG